MSYRVAVVVPFYKRNLEWYESVSVHRTVEALAEQGDIVFCGPDHLPLRELDFQLDVDYSSVSGAVQFESRYFESTNSYNNLLLSPHFYRTFDEYEYILVAQPDVFVFGTDLQRWCNAGYDYVGAPWWEGWDDPDLEAQFVGVGNGGLSLRNVESALQVLHTFKYITPPRTLLQRVVKSGFSLGSIYHLIMNSTLSNNTFYILNDYDKNEDVFWGIEVNKLFEDYEVPSPKEAIEFSFEVNPKKSYRMNERNLPFGCHGWEKYEFQFWRKKIRKFGYDV
jgi:hypothetical protein